MNKLQIVIGLLVGLVPYYIHWDPRARRRYALEVRAVFWSLRVGPKRKNGREIVVRVPLIERLRDAAWAVVAHLRDGGDDDDDA